MPLTRHARHTAQESIVAGGGVALARAAKVHLTCDSGFSLERADGHANPASRARRKPVRRIAENAGLDGARLMGEIEGIERHTRT